MFDKPEPQKMWAANCSHSYYRIIKFFISCLLICVHVFMYVTLFVAIVLGHQYNNTRQTSLKMNFTM
jgi:hypothetical protein